MLFRLTLAAAVAALAALTTLTAPLHAPAAAGHARGAAAALAASPPSRRHAAKKPTKTRARARQTAAAGPPDDPLWSAAWGLRAAGAPGIWRAGQGSPDIVVAVVDTGVDPTQADLAGALVPGWNTLTGTADTADDSGHGTAVAGVIAGRANNRIGASGYCPRCSIMPIKALDATGHAGADKIAAGIEWAVAHGANVINLSLVLTGRDDSVAAAVADAAAHGVVVVAAAGNDGGSSPTYPGAEPGVVSVAGTDPSRQLYSWSERGGWVSVEAPGCNETGNLAHGFDEFCGTSSAAAATSGLLGLALSQSASVAAIRAALPATPAAGAAMQAIPAPSLLASVVRRTRTS